MKQRIITGAVMFIIFAPLYVLGGCFSTALIMFLAYFGTYELINMYQTKNNIPNICKYIVPLFSLLIVLVSGIVSGGFGTFIYILIIIGSEFVGLLVLSIFDSRISLKDCIFFMFSNAYSGITFAIFEFMRNLNKLPIRVGTDFEFKVLLFNTIDIRVVGLILLTFVIITVMATDIGAYNFGMLFGKHKLCPNISPKKTIEGAIGGALSGAIFGTGYITLLTFLLEPSCEYQIRFLNIESNVWYLIAIFGIALIVSIAGQLGDLVASKLKREYEIKDYGKIFPGHGGVLDRFDSTILGGLVFYIIIFIIGVL